MIFLFFFLRVCFSLLLFWAALRQRARRAVCRFHAFLSFSLCYVWFTSVCYYMRCHCTGEAMNVDDDMHWFLGILWYRCTFVHSTYGIWLNETRQVMHGSIVHLNFFFCSIWSVSRKRLSVLRIVFFCLE